MASLLLLRPRGALSCRGGLWVPSQVAIAPANGGAATRAVVVFLSATAAAAAIPQRRRDGESGAASPRSGAGTPSR